MTDKKYQIIDLLKECESEKDLEYVLARSLEYVRASMDLKRLQKWADEHHEKTVDDNESSSIDNGGDNDITTATENKINGSDNNSQSNSDESSLQNEAAVDMNYTKIAQEMLLPHIIDQFPEATDFKDRFRKHIECNIPYETYEDVNNTYNLFINAIGEIFYDEHDERFNENNEESLYINKSDTSLVTYLDKEHKLSKEAKQNFEELYIE